MDWFLYDNGLRHERVKLDYFCCDCQMNRDLYQYRKFQAQDNFDNSDTAASDETLILLTKHYIIYIFRCLARCFLREMGVGVKMFRKRHIIFSTNAFLEATIEKNFEKYLRRTSFLSKISG